MAKYYEDNFDDCIFTDECTIELRKESYKRWFKKLPLQVERGKIGKPKHNVKVHIWAGISRRGKTNLIIFQGKMNSLGFQEIICKGLLPLIVKKISVFTSSHYG